MPGTTLPPFPTDVPTAPLLVIDYELLKNDDAKEIGRLWEAATELGFWYLKNHGVDDEVDGMFQMGAETMDLPLEEKMKFEQGDNGQSFGYKKTGGYVVDKHGNPDKVEFINVAKDDIVAYPEVSRRTYPSTVNARMMNTCKPFFYKSWEVTNRMLDIFEKKLGLPKGGLAQFHTLLEKSGSETRCIKNPPKRRGEVIDDSTALGAHTDFGSLTFLHNRIGGLQVLPPGTETFLYVKPLPGHAVCNIGDTLTLFSGGMLKSNIHRVVTPPGEHAYYERWSLAFFMRPGLDVKLFPLAEESQVISDYINALTDDEREKLYPDSTAGEWYARRNKMTRVKNRKDSKTWYTSRGTEHKPNAY